MRDLLIIGAGGHGMVVADTAQETGNWKTISFLDNKYPNPTSIFKWNILDKIENVQKYSNKHTDLIVALGDNALRVNLMSKYKQMGFRIARIIHPRSFVSHYAEIEEGTVVFAQAVINARAVIGSGSIINTGSTVDHDCTLGKGVHISPGAHLAGNVKIGDLSWIGIGASIIQQITIGSNVIVGAGSVIIHDISDNSKIAGVPGKALI